jgi:hypothetical protein
MNTLALLPRNDRGPRLERTPFGEVVEILERGAPTASTDQGRVSWSALPIRALLADAGILLVDAVAKRLSHALLTATDANTVAERADAWLCLGLALGYADPAAAAAAFRKQVIGSLDLALSLGYRPGSTLTDVAWQGLMRGEVAAAQQELRRKPTPPGPTDLASFWRRPGYLFLAANVKRGREEMEMLRQTADRLESRNRHRLLLEPLDDELSVLGAIESGKGRQTLSHADYTVAVAALRESLARYDALLQVSEAVMRSEPVAVGPIPDGRFPLWVRTAVLKVMLGDRACSSGALSPAAAMDAWARAKTVAPRTVSDIVVAEVTRRVLAAGRIPPAVALRFIRSLAEQTVESLGGPLAPTPDLYDIDPDLGAMDDDLALDLSHDAAMAYLYSTETLSPNLAASIERGIDWGALDWDDLTSVLERLEVNAHALVRQVPNMQADCRDAVIPWFLEEHPESIDTFIDAGLVPLDGTLLGEYAAHLSVPHTVVALRDRVSHTGDLERELGGLIRVLREVKQAALARLWVDEAAKPALSRFTYDLLFSLGPFGAASATDIDDVASRAGKPFERLAANAYAYYRGLVYQDVDVADEPRLPRWTASHLRSHPDIGVSAMVRLFGGGLGAVLAARSEDECHAEYVGLVEHGSPDPETFTRRRERYYSGK